MTPLNPNSATPLYLQLATQIKTLILEGKLKSGDQIMTELSLTQEYNVSRITVRKAIDLLVSEKILFRKQGKGTFVAYPEFFEDARIQERSFTASFLKKDSIPYTQILSQGIIPINESLRKTFDLPSSDKEIIQITRLRYINNQPSTYETDYLPMKYRSLLDLNLENRSLYELFHEILGIDLTDFSDSFSIIRAEKSYAHFLEVEEMFPLLNVLQTVFNKEHQVVYYNQQMINTERYTYQVQSFS